MGAIAVPGLLAVVYGFVWFVRSMRADLKDDRRAFREDITASHQENREDIQHAQRQFTSYLIETGSKQTEVMVATANALQANTQAQLMAEKRAEQRHELVVGHLNGLSEIVSDQGGVLRDLAKAREKTA